MNARITRLWCAVCRTGFDDEGLDVFLAHDCSEHTDRAQFETRFLTGLALLVTLSVGIVVLCGGAL